MRRAQVYEHGLSLNSSALLSGAGLKFEGRYLWDQLGVKYDVYYLSVFVYDTGFGPVSDGQYVKFFVNGHL